MTGRATWKTTEPLLAANEIFCSDPGQCGTGISFHYASMYRFSQEGTPPASSLRQPQKGSTVCLQMHLIDPGTSRNMARLLIECKSVNALERAQQLRS